jgi:hypothetical protein
MAMNANAIIRRFGEPASADDVETMFDTLRTYQRPTPSEDRRSFYDWVLIRRQGVELGFADSEYHTGVDRFRWGNGELLLTQAYFYAGFDDVQGFTGELPFGLTFADDRDTARAKLAVYEATRHSYRSDAWDVDGYRLTVTYVGGGTSIDRIACRVLASPIPPTVGVDYPEIGALTEAFGHTTHAREFGALWSSALADDDYRDARDDGEMDLTRNYGATLHFAESSSGPVFRAITLHRNRDMESVGWSGALPQGLAFEDSPEVLFKKISAPPVQHADLTLTGHAVWHLPHYTMHVLYSNVDNRLLRIKMIAPGTWKCIEDCDAGKRPPEAVLR